MFDNQAYNIHEQSPKEANEVEEDDLTDSEEESKEQTNEEAAAKFPYFWDYIIETIAHLELAY